MVPSQLYSKEIFIGKEFREYVERLLGEDLTKGYFEKISTPMEEYSLHVFKQYEKIDNIIEEIRSYGYQSNIHPTYSNLIITKPKGPFKLDFEEGMKEIVIDNRAAEMVYQGSDVFVPGVKRANKVKADDIVRIVNQAQLPVAKCKAQMSHHEMLKAKKGIAAKNILSPFTVPSLEQLKLTDFPAYFQSVPAFLTSINLNPQPGEKILDCCAAPGNKTIHLNELTKGEATIVAVDRSKNRLRKLDEKIRKFEIGSIDIMVGDIVKLSKQWSVKFDKILIDPPCTSLGLRPRLVLDTSKRIIQATADYQKAILYSCNELLKSGGSMIYSTCTITEEENERIIEYAIKDLGLKIIEQEHILSEMRSIDRNLPFPVQRFVPGKHPTLGFFIAKLAKPSS